MNKVQNFLNTLKANCDNTPFVSYETENEAEITISLGKGWAGKYANDLWGECEITDDELEITFVIENYEEFYIGEGTVRLTYADDSTGKAYGGELDDKVGAVLHKVTNGMLTCGGSEEGLQGEDYLSVDVAQCEILEEA